MQKASERFTATTNNDCDAPEPTTSCPAGGSPYLNQAFIFYNNGQEANTVRATAIATAGLSFHCTAQRNTTYLLLFAARFRGMSMQICWLSKALFVVSLGGFQGAAMGQD